MSVQACATIKERPLLFSGAMVRAILEGRKTQTRRIVKPQPFEVAPPAGNSDGLVRLRKSDECLSTWRNACPFGQPGDRIWVKETFSHVDDFHGKPLTSYRATDENPLPHWKPSIFMRRIYSRITLEIVAVRVERLQDISEEDARAEGVERMSHGFRDYSGKLDCQLGQATSSYLTLWESINGPGAWERNPWVWVVEFRRLHAPETLSGHHARGTAGLEHPAPAQSPAHAGGAGQSLTA